MIPQTKIEQALNEMYPNDELYPVVFNRGFRSGVRFAESEIGQAQTFEIEFCGHVKAKIEFKDGELNVIAAMNGYGDALDPDQITITKSITQPTCPECGSTRVLDWPDKFQCRRCEHVWGR